MVGKGQEQPELVDKMLDVSPSGMGGEPRCEMAIASALATTRA